MAMKLDSVKLDKKVRCTVCRSQVMDGQVVQVVRNAKKKIKAYLCKPQCAGFYDSNPGVYSGNAFVPSIESVTGEFESKEVSI